MEMCGTKTVAEVAAEIMRGAFSAGLLRFAREMGEDRVTLGYADWCYVRDTIGTDMEAAVERECTRILRAELAKETP